MFDLDLPFRFTPRAPGGWTMVRKDLLRSLTEASLVKQLSIVRGAAGSGKTTLMSQWRDVGRGMDRPIAWLTVNAADRTPAHFVSGLVAALEQAGCPAMASGFRAALEDIDMQTPLVLAQRLASAINRSREMPVIVLDQYECMDCTVAGEIISGLLFNATTARIVIASRTRPSIPLGNVRARDQLFEIAPSDLNLTALETRAVFDEDVPELYARRLHLETSGEMIAIGFARRAHEDVPRDMIGAENWQEQLHEYYRGEVVDGLPPELRAAISRLVVVERFDLSLASTLIGGDATGIIERLHHIDGILLRHRGTPDFYFSEMLRRFLKRRLVALEEQEYIALHERASAWFAERERHYEALRHAVSAGNSDSALALLDRVGYANLLAQGSVSESHQLLDAIDVGTDTAPAATLLSLALIHAHEGNAVKAAERIEEARRKIAAEPRSDPVIDGQRLVTEAFVVGFRDETLDVSNAAALEAYLASAPANAHDGRAQAQILLSWDRFCRGDIVGAEELAGAAAANYQETDGVYGHLFMHVHRTLARFWRNDLDRALEEISLAGRMTRIFFPDDQRLRAMTGVLRSGLMFELGRPDPLTDVTGLVGMVGALESWIDIQIWSHVHGARVAAAGGRGSEARGILSYGIETAKRMDAPRMDWSMRLCGVDVAIRLGDLDRARHDARAMNLPGAGFLSGEAGRLTWQEEIGGVLAVLRLADADGDRDAARRMAAVARDLIGRTSASRFAVELEIAQAGLELRDGNDLAARAHVEAALALCPDALPIRLFLDGGDGLRPYLPELPPPSVAVIRADSLTSNPVPAEARDPLTARERQILLFMGEGHANKVAAHELGLSETTVKFHLRNIYRKLQAHNRTQALARYRTLVELW